MEKERPNPDLLLKYLQAEEAKSKKGHLKIFLGMSAGVGKTYAMLEDAQERKKEGVNVVVGTVNTHGRHDTARLLRGLTVLPEKKILYKDTLLHELNLDSILKLKPSLVIVDELAHTNAPGSRHPKRWQDVIEILEAGIDVYTTLNIQHIESRKDVVETISGITMRETVPDLIIEKATEIVLIDITPDALLQRLKEGKVYLGTQSEIAALNFFQKDRLTALREVVMRFAAEKVDHDLHEMTFEHKQHWKIRERLMVAITHRPQSQKLIRATRRLAFNLDAPWVAVYVDVGMELNDNDQQQLSKNLALARELGAEVVMIQDTNIASSLAKVATQKGVTQIVIGRHPKSNYLSFIQGSLMDKLSIEIPDVDIHVIRQDFQPFEKHYFFFFTKDVLVTKWQDYGIAAIFVIVMAFFCGLLTPFLDHKVIGILFFIGVLSLSLFAKMGPILFAAIGSFLIWTTFFTPKTATFSFSNPNDLILIFLLLCTSMTTAYFANKSRVREKMSLKREASNQAIYEIVKEIATAPSTKDILKAVKNRLGVILNGICEIIVKKSDQTVIFEKDSPLVLDEKEKEIVEWVFEHEKEAGWSTHTLSSKSLYIPLKGYKEMVGVLRFHPNMPHSMSTEELNFLYTITKQLGNYLERTFSEERARKAEQINQVEKIYETILKSISREFQKPLSTIQEGIKDLKHEKIPPIHKIENSSKNLARIVDNISAMAKLCSDLIPLYKEPCVIKDLITLCCNLVKNSLKSQELKIQVQDNLPQLMIDISLIQILICNLLFNAIEYSPPGSTIKIEAKIDDERKHVVIAVSDEGEGIPEDKIPLIFEKFFRLPGTASSGVGLGLAIAKTIAEIHQGQLKVENLKIKGSCFSLILPID